MTRIEATDLAIRILGAFNGPNAREWEEELETLDAGRAGTAFARCRREHTQRWLSIADYLTVYRSLNTEDASNRPIECGECGDSGWTCSPPYWEHGQVYSGAEPCNCRAGDRAKASTTWRTAQVREFLTERQSALLVAEARGAPVPKETA